MKAQQIKMGNTAISAVFAQSFNTEEEFINALENEVFPRKDIISRRKILKEAYKIGQKMKSDKTSPAPKPVPPAKEKPTIKSAKTAPKKSKATK